LFRDELSGANCPEVYQMSRKIKKLSPALGFGADRFLEFCRKQKNLVLGPPNLKKLEFFIKKCLMQLTSVFPRVSKLFCFDNNQIHIKKTPTATNMWL
jgi:hypothetical protein